MADRLFQIRSSIYPENISIENIKNKVLVIFGGTSGIGESTSILAKQNGAIVYTPSITTGCDVSDYEQVKSHLEKIYNENGKIDYVINTAGVLKIGKLIERNIDDMQKEININ